MEEIKINKNSLLEAYKAGNKDQKEMLEHLYGKETFKHDWRKITSYEKACAVLGLPIDFDKVGYRLQYVKIANAVLQLLTICEAINENGKWYDNNGVGYYPILSLYKKSDIEMLEEEELKRNGIHKIFTSVYSSNADVAGVRYFRTYCRSVSTAANFGFPICLNSEEKAEFVGKQFFELCCQCYGIIPIMN